MQKKWWIVLNVFVLIIVILTLGFFVWIFSVNGDEIVVDECIEVNKVSSFVYDACYDAYSKMIFMEIQRGQDAYKINSMSASFFDFSEQAYDLTDVPNIKDARAFKIPAEKNPQSIDMALNIVKDFSSPICDDPRKVFVRYCPTGVGEDGVDVSIGPLENVKFDDFIEVEKSPRQDSDVLALSLVDKERVWKSQCESKWKCDEWESCVDGIQKRECSDSSDCFIPTGVPDTVKYCDAGCIEEWECEWSDCSAGFTIPKCKDLNRCGKSYNIPKKLECGKNRCVPDIGCSEWTDCDVNYNFMDLVGGAISDLSGTKSRICVDDNSCADSVEEVKSCSVNVDIYTRRFSKCGQDFIGIYDRLDNDLIARIEEGYANNPHLNIHLDDGKESEFCDYCFDGMKNGDETGIDCGGSCQICSEKFKRVDFEKKGWFGRFTDWFKRLIT
jgi:hypothetical protein